MARLAAGGDEELWIAAALRAACGAARTPKELRQLNWQVLDTSRMRVLGAQAPAVENDAIDDLDVVLCTICEAAGCEDKLQVDEAKKLLRAHGERGVRAAKWLGEFSKLRNGRAHPKARRLAMEVQAIFKESKFVDEDLFAERCEGRADGPGQAVCLDGLGGAQAAGVEGHKAATLGGAAHHAVPAGPPCSCAMVQRGRSNHRRRR